MVISPVVANCRCFRFGRFVLVKQVFVHIRCHAVALPRPCSTSVHSRVQSVQYSGVFVMRQSSFVYCTEYCSTFQHDFRTSFPLNAVSCIPVLNARTPVLVDKIEFTHRLHIVFSNVLSRKKVIDGSRDDSVMRPGRWCEGRCGRCHSAALSNKRYSYTCFTAENTVFAGTRDLIECLCIIYHAIYQGVPRLSDHGQWQSQQPERPPQQMWYPMVGFTMNLTRRNPRALLI